MNRKFWTILISVLLIFTLFITITACGEKDKDQKPPVTPPVDDGDDPAPEEPEQEFAFSSLPDGNLSLSGFTGDVVDVVIPGEYDGVKVVEIGNDCFKSCTTLKSVQLPDGIKRIGDHAFSNCTNLTSINIPESVEEIGDYCFSNTGVLEKTSNGIYYVGKWAVQYDRSNYSDTFIVREGTVGIATGAFMYYGPSSIVLPSSVKYVNRYGFGGNGNLKSVTMSEGILSLGESAFSGCTALTNLAIPSSVTYIGDKAFSGCESIVSVNISKNVTYIGAQAFYQAWRLNAINVDKDNAHYCSVDGSLYNLSKTILIQYAVGKTDYHFEIPQSVIRIEAGAFYGATKLYSLTINNMFSIGQDAFGYCPNISEVYNLTGQDFGVNNEKLGEWGITPGQIKYVHSNKHEQSAFTLLDEKYLVLIVDVNVTIITYYGTEADLTIPQNVTEIGMQAFENNSYLRSVVIPSNVKKIGNNAFNGCKNLTHVQIEEGVEKIGDGAFRGSGIENVSLPSSVTELGFLIFADCNSLISVIISSNATNVGNGMFENCKNLESVTVREGVTNLGNRTFVNCEKLEYVSLPSTILEIGVEVFYNCKSLITITLGEKVQVINTKAFAGSGLTSITLTKWVARIGQSAFENCLSLVEVRISQALNSIEPDAFNGCEKLSQFVGNEENFTYTVVDGNLYKDGGTALVKYAPGKTDKEFVVPSGVQMLLPSSISEAKNLEKVVLPKTITNIDVMVFRLSINITIIYYVGSETEWNTISKQFSWDIDMGTFEIIFNYGQPEEPEEPSEPEVPEEPEEPGEPEVPELPEDDVEYEDGTPYLTFTLKENDTYEVSGFTGEPKNISIPTTYNGKAVTSIGESAFVECATLLNVKIPEGITQIGGTAFVTCPQIISISIPASCVEIGDFAFALNATIKDIKVAGANPNFKSVDGTLYSKEGTKLIQYALGREETSFNIPEGVETICQLAFAYGVKLQTVNIASSVVTIEYDAFSTATSLVSVTFSANSNLTYLVEGSFIDCTSLVSCTLPNSVKVIGPSVFNGCSSLEGTVIGKGSQLEVLGRGAFRNCTSLTSIYIPDSTKSFGYTPIVDGCTSLVYEVKNNVKYLGSDSNPYIIAVGLVDNTVSSVVLDDNCKFVHYEAFAYAQNLVSINLGKSLLSIGNLAFYYSSSIETIIIPDTLVDVGNNTFDGFMSPDSTIGTIANGIRYFGNETNPYLVAVELVGGSELDSLIFQEGCKVVNSYKFAYNANITTIYISNTVITLSEGAFRGLSNLATIYYSGTEAEWNLITKEEYWDQGTGDYEIIFNYVLPGDTIEYEDGTPYLTFTLKEDDTYEVSGFSGSPVNISIPSTYEGKAVTSIGAEALIDCFSLENIFIPRSITDIGILAIADCTSLLSIKVDENNAHYMDIDGDLYTKEGLTIVQYALGKSATSFTIPSTVTTIGYGAFACCSLNSVSMGDSVISIDDYAFYNSPSLATVGMGEKVITIGMASFAECRSLTGITIPATVTSIGLTAFSASTSLLSIEVDENNTVYKDIEGNLYSKDGQNLIQYAVGKAETTFNIPNGVVEISWSAFIQDSSLATVTIPNTVDIINGYAFYGCTSLNNVIIPDSVDFIGEWAFADCTGLTNIVLTKTRDAISICAFSGCEALSVVYFNGTEEDWDTLTIDDGNSELTDATIYYYSEYYPGMGDNYWHFVDGIPTIWIIHSCVDEDENHLCDVCSKKLSCKDLNNDHYCDLCSQIISPCVDDNGDLVCDVCGGGDVPIMLNFTLKDDDTYEVIGYEREFENVIIPSTYEGKAVTSIGASAFKDNYSITSVTIPNSVTSIGNWAFDYCTELVEVKIGTGVSSISSTAFECCYKLSNLTIDENNPYFKVVDGNVYSKDGTTFVKYNISNREPYFTIPDTVTTILEGAFNEALHLVKVVIPASVRSIPNEVFRNCYKLIEVYNLSTVEVTAKHVYTSLETESKVSIDSQNCVLYTDGDMVSLVAYLGNQIFLHIPSYVTEIYDYAFVCNEALYAVVIPKSVKKIGINILETNMVAGTAQHIETIYYCGSEEEWNAIEKHEYWLCTDENVTIEYNYSYITNVTP